jgi:hypothetical protein
LNLLVGTTDFRRLAKTLLSCRVFVFKPIVSSGNIQKKGMLEMADMDNYIPSENEIDEVLTQYDSWLQEEYETHGDPVIAIDRATERVTSSSSHKVFFWVAENDNARIYDVDDTIVK